MSYEHDTSPELHVHQIFMLHHVIHNASMACDASWVGLHEPSWCTKGTTFFLLQESNITSDQFGECLGLQAHFLRYSVFRRFSKVPNNLIAWRSPYQPCRLLQGHPESKVWFFCGPHFYGFGRIWKCRQAPQKPTDRFWHSRCSNNWPKHRSITEIKTVHQILLSNGMWRVDEKLNTIDPDFDHVFCSMLFFDQYYDHVPGLMWVFDQSFDRVPILTWFVEQ